MPLPITFVLSLYTTQHTFSYLHPPHTPFINHFDPPITLPFTSTTTILHLLLPPPPAPYASIPQLSVTITRLPSQRRPIYSPLATSLFLPAPLLPLPPPCHGNKQFKGSSREKRDLGYVLEQHVESAVC